MKTILVIASLTLMASGLVLLAGSIVPHPSEQTSQRLAATWLTNGPTFRFDGIRASLTLTSTVKLRTPYTWDYRYRFDCSHSGYGDRSGKNVLQVITPHIATVRVMRGVVVLAIVDVTWDEIGQKFTTDADSNSRSGILPAIRHQ